MITICMWRRGAALLWLIVPALVPTTVVGHHGSNTNPALYLAENLLELEGEITEVFWRNPHPRLRMTVLGEGVGETVWELELPGSVIGLHRGWGITADSFQAGDAVKAAGVVSRRDLRSIGVLHLLLPNGQEFVNGNRENRWSTQRVAVQQADPVNAGTGGEPPDSIFRVWGSPVPQRSWLGFTMPEYQRLYTERGREVAAEYDPVTDDPELNCQQGFPGAMLSPVPWEMIDGGDHILIRLQEFDLERIIYLDANAVDEPQDSPLGYSVGRWEGDTLVVNTTRVDWPYFDRGTPQSNQANHVERFTVSENGSELDYSVVSHDPVMYEEPITFQVTWAWEPGAEVTPYNCAAEWEGSSVEG